MIYILHIETSETVCSVALSKDSRVIAYKEVSDEKSHASKLAVIAKEIIKESNIDNTQLNAIAVSKGPGSYTGLRIGVSFTKGLCYALNIPLIGIGTLHSLFHGYLHSHEYRKTTLVENTDVYFCPMIDARRMEVYSCLYDRDGNEVAPVTAEIIHSGSFSEILNKRSVIFFGSGALKCQGIIQHDNAYFVPDFLPKAKFLVPLAHEYFQKGQFENTAYFEPYYLKDFVAIKPKNKVI